MSATSPLTVVVSGAAGQIGYSLLPLLANGRVFKDHPIHLRLLDVGFPGVPENLAGIKMELEDGAYATLASVQICIGELDKAFTNADVAILTGGFPRKAGMERKDLIAKNAAIFGEQGEAIEKYASSNIKVLVIANPANTNCLILQSAAPKVPKSNFSALTFLDHNRARGQIALKLGVSAAAVTKVCIWGNHSKTQVPDATFGEVTKDGVTSKITDLCDAEWLAGEFVKTVATRGSAVIAARQKSSAMSAASAIGDHIRTWLITGSPENDFVSLAVPSDGSYGIAPGLVFSFPCTCPGDGTYKIVTGLEITDEKMAAMKASEAELLQEKADADDILAAK